LANDLLASWVRGWNFICTMNEFRVTLTGSADLLDALETLFRTCGVVTERGVVSSYDRVAVSAPAVHAVASRDVLARCISAYGVGQKAPHKVTYFLPGKGFHTVKDYSFNAIAEVLGQTEELCLEYDARVSGG
jgi:hypothetical protein